MLGLVLKNNTIDNQANEDAGETRISEAKTVLGRRRNSAVTFGLAVHVQVTAEATNLLADDGTEDNCDELEGKLLRVETVARGVDLRNFDGEKHAAETEDHGVAQNRNEDVDVANEQSRTVEIAELERSWVNATEGEILALESRSLRLRLATDVEGLGAEEEVEDELNCVDNGIDAINPDIAAGVVCDKAHDERSHARAQGDE